MSSCGGVPRRARPGFQEEVPMQRGWLRAVVRYPLVVLVEQGRLSQEEAAREMGLSTRQVRRVLKRYRESGGRLESRRAAPWASGTVEEAPLPLAAPGRPPASEGGVRDLRRFTEATGTQARMPATQLLEGDDVTDPCRYGPGCARLVHVGPPVDRSVAFLSAYPTVGPAFVHPLSVSHVLEHHNG
jgi:hypothetical protein